MICKSEFVDVELFLPDLVDRVDILRLQRDSTRNSSNQTEDPLERNKLTETRYRIQRDQTENKERAELWRHITVTHVGRAFPHPVTSGRT